MPSTFVRARTRNHRLLHTAKRGAVESTPPSLVVVGVGTAGVRRSMLFSERMSELSAAGRIQTAVYYDCNEVTVANVQKTLQKSFGVAKTGAGTQVLFPNYVPLPNGFMRDPTRYRDFRGPLERDMDNVINQVVLHSERCGRVPETIIEFMGFSGQRGAWRPTASEAAKRVPQQHHASGHDAAERSRLRGMDQAIYLGTI